MAMQNLVQEGGVSTLVGAQRRLVEPVVMLSLCLLPACQRHLLCEPNLTSPASSSPLCPLLAAGYHGSTPMGSVGHGPGPAPPDLAENLTSMPTGITWWTEVCACAPGGQQAVPV